MRLVGFSGGSSWGDGKLGWASESRASRERVVQAQEATMAALNIPSAADIERLTRRVRSVSQRLEGIEGAVDRLDERLAMLSTPGSDPDQRLGAIESKLDVAARGSRRCTSSSGAR